MTSPARDTDFAIIDSATDTLRGVLRTPIAGRLVQAAVKLAVQRGVFGDNIVVTQVGDLTEEQRARYDVDNAKVTTDPNNV